VWGSGVSVHFSVHVADALDVTHDEVTAAEVERKVQESLRRAARLSGSSCNFDSPFNTKPLLLLCLRYVPRMNGSMPTHTEGVLP
jgi:hypothetical protein